MVSFCGDQPRRLRQRGRSLDADTNILSGFGAGCIGKIAGYVLPHSRVFGASTDYKFETKKPFF